jgi:hypothetical protein
MQRFDYDKDGDVKNSFNFLNSGSPEFNSHPPGSIGEVMVEISCAIRNGIQQYALPACDLILNPDRKWPLFIQPDQMAVRRKLKKK